MDALEELKKMSYDLGKLRYNNRVFLNLYLLCEKNIMYVDLLIPILEFQQERGFEEPIEVEIRYLEKRCAFSSKQQVRNMLEALERLGYVRVLDKTRVRKYKSVMLNLVREWDNERVVQHLVKIYKEKVGSKVKTAQKRLKWR